MDRGAWWDAVHEVTRSWTRLSDFTLFFHFHALEKEMATHSSILAWRIPVIPGGLPSMGSHRVRHDWRDLASSSSICYLLEIPCNSTVANNFRGWFSSKCLLTVPRKKSRLFFISFDSTLSFWGMSFVFKYAKPSPGKPKLVVHGSQNLSLLSLRTVISIL